MWGSKEREVNSKNSSSSRKCKQINDRVTHMDAAGGMREAHKAGLRVAGGVAAALPGQGLLVREQYEDGHALCMLCGSSYVYCRQSAESGSTASAHTHTHKCTNAFIRLQNIKPPTSLALASSSRSSRESGKRCAGRRRKRSGQTHCPPRKMEALAPDTMGR